MARVLQISLILACVILVVKPSVPVRPLIIVEDEADSFDDDDIGFSSPIGLGIGLLFLAAILPGGMMGLSNIFNNNNGINNAAAGASVITASNGASVIMMGQGGGVNVVDMGRGGGAVTIPTTTGRGGIIGR